MTKMVMWRGRVRSDVVACRRHMLRAYRELHGHADDGTTVTEKECDA